MARAGSFGTSLTPFGGGATSLDRAYSVGNTGAEAAELRRYEIAVRWANGQATNEEYLDSLREAISAADPATRDKLSAQNTYDDALYRIGRANVEGDPDKLIAFDQDSLSRMTPGSLRYQQVSESLASQLADRRGRQYSDIVEQFNAGRATTETLLAWVTSTLASLPAGAPDRDNWQSTAVDLRERVTGERDSKVFQDYQQGRMKGPEFITYLTSRRDSYISGTPLYNDWSRKLEDAQKQVKSSALAEMDSRFFDGTAEGGFRDGYNDGAKSDASYLKYIDQRIAQMDAADPDRAEWENRRETASFSLAESKLRFEVGQGRRPATELATFYDVYRRTLNPASAEYRTITGRMDEAKSAAFGERADQLRFAAAVNPAQGGAFVSFLENHLATLTPGTADYRSTYIQLENARQGIYAEEESRLRFAIEYPGALATTATGLPTGGGGGGGARPGTAAPFAGGTFTFKGRGYSGDDNSATGASLHSGFDLTAPRGTPVRALADGTVTFAATGTSAGAAGAHAIGGGNVVNVRDGGGTYQYAHLDRFTVASGASVKKGDIIGYVGNTGPYTSGYHLHVGREEGGLWIDPTTANTGIRSPADIIGALEGTTTTTAAPVTAGPAITPADRNLLSFYDQQMANATQGTADWRSAYDKKQTLLRSIAARAEDDQAIPGGLKAIPSGADDAAIVRTLAINPGSSAYERENFKTNLESLQNAVNRGDPTWTFVDPAGGAQVRPVNDNLYGQLLNNNVTFLFDSAAVARAEGRHTDAQRLLGDAFSADDTLWGVEQKVWMRGLDAKLEASRLQEELALRNGDLAGVVNAKNMQNDYISAMLTDKLLDDTRKDQLKNDREAIANDPLMPDIARGRLGFDIDNSISREVEIKDANGTVVGTRIVYDHVTLGPGQHLVFSLEGGDKTFRVAHEDETPTTDWASNHVPIHARFGDKIVTAEAPLRETSLIEPQVRASLDGVSVMLNRPSAATKSVTFFDGSGATQVAYTMDGVSWIRSNTGVLPQVEIAMDLVLGSEDPITGLRTYVDKTTGEQVLVIDANRNIMGKLGESAAPNIRWYGQAAAEQGLQANPLIDPSVSALVERGATREEIENAVFQSQLAAWQRAGGPDVKPVQGTRFGVGAPDQSMTLSYLGVEGVNMLPAHSAPLHEIRFARATDTLAGRSAQEIIGRRIVEAIAGAPTNGARPKTTATGMPLEAQLPPNTPRRVAGEGFPFATHAPVSPITPRPPVALPIVKPIVPISTPRTPAYTSPQVRNTVTPLPKPIVPIAVPKPGTTPAYTTPAPKRPVVTTTAPKTTATGLPLPPTAKPPSAGSPAGGSKAV